MARSRTAKEPGSSSGDSGQEDPGVVTLQGKTAESEASEGKATPSSANKLTEASPVATGTLSICIVHWNTPALLADLLKSIDAQPPPASRNMEIIVVDNASAGID